MRALMTFGPFLPMKHFYLVKLGVDGFIAWMRLFAPMGPPTNLH